MTRSILFITLLAGISFSLPSAAKMYKWVDDQGTTHYGESIPPEFANKNRVELNKEGRVMKKIGVLTPEERLAKKEAEAKKQAEDKIATDQKRHDATLMNIYSNVAEIELARKRNLQQIEARITNNRSQLKMADSNLMSLQKEADKRKQDNKPILESLQEDIQQSQSQVTKLQANLNESLAEKATIEARFDADKARYKELTGK